MIDKQEFDPETIQYQGKLPAACIPYRDREHPDETTDGAFDPPLFKGREDYLGVGVAPESAPAGFQLSAQGSVVVNFAVENDDIPSARGAHRLMTLRGKVDDGQAPKAERYPDRGVNPNAIVVGPAVSDRPAHAQCDAVKRLGIPASTRKHSGQSTHNECRLCVRIDHRDRSAYLRGGSRCPVPGRVSHRDQRAQNNEDSPAGVRWEHEERRDRSPRLRVAPDHGDCSNDERRERSSDKPRNPPSERTADT